MGRPFDIFRLDPNGGAVRCAATNSIDEALTTIEQFNKIERGIEFLILNRETKEQIIVKPRGITTQRLGSRISAGYRQGFRRGCSS